MLNEPRLFQQTKPTIIRIWHWLVFLFLVASVSTVVVQSLFFKTRDNVAMVQNKVQEKGGLITPDQAKNVAHEYSDKLWTLHKYIGFGISFLFVWRLVAEAVVAKEKKVKRRINIAQKLPESNKDKKHYLMVQYSYLIFYLLFLIMVSTGLILAFEDVDFFKSIHRAAKNIHSLCQWGMYGFMLFHITGVIIAECGDFSGIVSRMINGKEAQ